MAFDYVDFGKRVRFIRESRLLTQAELAKAINLSVEELQRIENGTTIVYENTLSAICSTLDVLPSYLMQKSLKTESVLKRAQASPVVLSFAMDTLPEDEKSEE